MTKSLRMVAAAAVVILLGLSILVSRDPLLLQLVIVVLHPLNKTAAAEQAQSVQASNRGDWAGAVAHSRKAAVAQPRDATLQIELALRLAENDEVKEAKQVLRRVAQKGGPWRRNALGLLAPGSGLETASVNTKKRQHDWEESVVLRKQNHRAEEAFVNKNGGHLTGHGAVGLSAQKQQEYEEMAWKNNQAANAVQNP